MTHLDPESVLRARARAVQAAHAYRVGRDREARRGPARSHRDSGTGAAAPSRSEWLSGPMGIFPWPTTALRRDWVRRPAGAICL